MYTFVFCGLILAYVAVCLVSYSVLLRSVYRKNRDFAKHMQQIREIDRRRYQQKQKETVMLARTLFISFVSFVMTVTPIAIALVFNMSDTWPAWVYTITIQVPRQCANVRAASSPPLRWQRVTCTRHAVGDKPLVRASVRNDSRMHLV